MLIAQQLHSRSNNNSTSSSSVPHAGLSSPLLAKHGLTLSPSSLSSPTQTTSGSSCLSQSSSSCSPESTSTTDSATTQLIKDDMISRLHSSLLSEEGGGAAGQFSALQRLEYALERNELFSNVFATTNNNDRYSFPGDIDEDIGEDDPDEGHGMRSPMNSPTKGRKSASAAAVAASSRRRLSTSTTSSGPDSVSDLMDHPHEFHYTKAHGAEIPDLSAAGAAASAATATATDLTSPSSSSGDFVALEPIIPDNIFQCPLCSITCNERHSFNEHLVTHTQQSACPKCDFITNTNDGESLQSHLQEAHDLVVGMTDDEVPVPKINAQSKIKKFKCKTCEHISITKMEFWSHTKSHIKHDKMLQCPKCPFVTEYKHHLEYHLRNHFGSKPFVCTHCPYSCVNKSMLASHLKSHSTIYQYRCADCDYATKYCHSLKMHLRKHGHGPQVVLNPDGTPNPLPIIDVYGTRRGPKLKKANYSLIPITQLQVKAKKVNKCGKRKQASAAAGATPPVKQEQKPEEPNNNNAPTARAPCAGNGKIKNLSPPPTAPRPVSTQIQISPSMMNLEKREITPEHLKMPNGHQRPQQQPQERLPQPAQQFSPAVPTMLQGLLLQNYGSKTNSTNSNHHGYKGQVSKQPKEEPPAPVIPPSPSTNFAQIPKNMLEFYAAAMNQYLLANNPVLFQQLLVNNNNNNGMGLGLVEQAKNIGLHSPIHTILGNNMSKGQGHEIQQHPETVALDLRASPSNGSFRSSEAPELGTNTGNNRKRTRKGRAHRYDRQQQQQQQYKDFSEEEEFTPEDDDIVLDFSNNNNGQKQQRRFSDNNNKPNANFGDISKCKYCDISFPDSFLYSMHMSYHYFGDSNPFLCKCGTKTKDKVSFFIHLTTEPH